MDKPTACPSSAVTVISSRSFGAAHILDAEWRWLALDQIFAGQLSGKTTVSEQKNLERAVFATVAHCALRPRSTAGIAEWASHDVVIPRSPDIPSTLISDALRLLRKREVRDQVMKAALSRLAQLDAQVVCLASASTSPAGSLIKLAVTDTGIPVWLEDWPADTLFEVRNSAMATTLQDSDTVPLVDIQSGPLNYSLEDAEVTPDSRRYRRVPDRFGADRLHVKVLSSGGMDSELRVAVEVTDFDDPNLEQEYLLRVSGTELSAYVIAQGYVAADEAGRDLSDLLTDPLRRPFTHQDRGGSAHLLTCWLALLLTRLAEYNTRIRWPEIHTKLDRLHEVSLTMTGKQMTCETSKSVEQQTMLDSAGIGVGPIGDC